MLEGIIVGTTITVIGIIFNDEIKKAGRYLKSKPLEALIFLGIVILIGLQIKYN